MPGNPALRAIAYQARSVGRGVLGMMFAFMMLAVMGFTFVVLPFLVAVGMIAFVVFAIVRRLGGVRVGVGDALARPAQNGDCGSGDGKDLAHQAFLVMQFVLAPMWRRRENGRAGHNSALRRG